MKYAWWLAGLGLTGAVAIAQELPGRAEQVAGLLAAADRADAQPSRRGRKDLAKAVATLDRLGAHADPVDPAGDAALKAWRARAGAVPPMRGRVLGPAFRRGQLDPGGSLHVEQLFLAGQSASVAVAATPGHGIDLAVTGPDAAPACTGGERACRWTPLYTQRYRIVLRNGGTARTRYYLVMD